MPCRCSDRRATIAIAARATLRGDLTKLRPAVAFVARTTVEDVETMARRMAGRVTGPVAVRICEGEMGAAQHQGTLPVGPRHGR